MSPRLSHENRVFALVFLASLPALAVALLLLWLGEFSLKLQWTLTLIVALWWLGFAFAARERVVRPLQTLSNLVAALAEGDFSIRARGAKSDEPLGLAFWEVNQLTDVLHEQRMGAVEATALLRSVMSEIDVAVLAFDAEHRLRLVNQAAARLLGGAPGDLVGRDASVLGLEDALSGDTPRVVEMPLTRGGGRWELRRGTFRQEGRPHELVVLADLSRTLREEERQAWKRLVRVLSHEINNSLAPIRSMSQSLGDMLARDDAVHDPDLARGLAIIGGRAEALIRFMQSYARLARLPAPARRPLDIEPWVQRVVRLETRLDVDVIGGPPAAVHADADQLDQVLINLLSNAVDAALETGGGVRVGWRSRNGGVDVWVEDDGPGIADATNLFVPFFTTKPKGTGIGLVLSRQIAEGHGGTLTLESRSQGHGCVARLHLPA
ncbi:MAG TPA: ATP-binding protein [Gemmatimonadales bacterium]|jgi:nitrogen fixation/metabolism regulation signal transduction histidine kinase